MKAGLRGNLYVPVCLTYLFMTDLNLQDGILSSDIPTQRDVCLKIGHCQRTGKELYKLANETIVVLYDSTLACCEA